MNWIALHWQDVTTWLVLAVAAGYLVRRVYRTVTSPGHGAACETCPAHRIGQAAGPTARHQTSGDKTTNPPRPTRTRLPTNDR